MTNQMHLKRIAADGSVVNTTNVNSEIVVDTNGEAWVSQTQVAKMCGVDRTSISTAIGRNYSYATGWILNENNQLSTKSAYDATVYFATQGKPEAIETLAMIGEAGMKSYLYHLAGYTMSATPIVSEAVGPIRPLLPVEEALCEFKVYKELLELVGVTGNAAVLGSNQATVSNTGIDLLARVGRKHLYQPEQVEVLNVTELGKRIGIGAIAMNLKLEGLGLQVKVRNKWVLTEAGKDYGVLLDTSKKQIVGTPVLQLKWKVTVLDLI